jgi:hypothetical protein
MPEIRNAQWTAAITLHKVFAAAIIGALAYRVLHPFV